VLDPRAIQRYSGLNLVVRLQKGFRQHAEDGVQPETKEERSLWAWMRIVLLVLYFRPFDLVDPQSSFRVVADRLLVAPVMRILVFKSISRAVLDWVQDVCEWDFKRVIPAHFEGPVATSPNEFRQCFSFLEVEDSTTCPQLRPEDRSLLDSIRSLLEDAGVILPFRRT